MEDDVIVNTSVAVLKIDYQIRKLREMLTTECWNRRKRRWLNLEGALPLIVLI